MDLTDKKILLGVSGSIAAYKAADLCSQLGKRGADIHVVLTPHAAQFVGVPTFPRTNPQSRAGGRIRGAARAANRAY